MRKHKYKFGNGLAFSEEKDIRMLESMAAKGYAFQKVNCLGFYKFAAAEAEDWVYSIDYSAVKKKDPGFGQYVEFFEAGGWRYITSMDYIHYFKAPKGTTPIYTDGSSRAEKYEIMGKFCLRMSLIAGLIAAVFLGLFIAFSTPWFSGVMGGALGGAYVMFRGMERNKRQAERLRHSASADDNGETAETYEKRSKSCLLSLLWALPLAALLVPLRIFGTRSPLELALVAVIAGLIAVHTYFQLWDFFSNKREAARLRKAGPNSASELKESE